MFGDGSDRDEPGNTLGIKDLLGRVGRRKN
jgi:hypothetical protein